MNYPPCYLNDNTEKTLKKADLLKALRVTGYGLRIKFI